MQSQTRTHPDSNRDSGSQEGLSYRDLLEIASHAFLLGMTHLNLAEGSYPITYQRDHIQCAMETAEGDLVVHSQRPTRDTAAGRMTLGGAWILRVTLAGILQDFGSLDGEFVENVERECSRILLA